MLINTPAVSLGAFFVSSLTRPPCPFLDIPRGLETAAAGRDLPWKHRQHKRRRTNRQNHSTDVRITNRQNRTVFYRGELPPWAPYLPDWQELEPGFLATYRNGNTETVSPYQAPCQHHASPVLAPCLQRNAERNAQRNVTERERTQPNACLLNQNRTTLEPPFTRQARVAHAWDRCQNDTDVISATVPYYFGRTSEVVPNFPEFPRITPRGRA